MASANFGKFALGLAGGNHVIATDTHKAVLVTVLPDETALDTWQFRSSVTNEHAATGGYTTGGFNVTVDSVVEDTTNNRIAVTYSAANPTYTGVTLAGVVGCVIYKVVGTAGTDRVMHLVDFAGTKGVTAGNFTVTFSTPFYINR